MNNSDIEKFIRPELSGFGGYSACKSPDVIGNMLGVAPGRIIKLDANENPYGTSDRVKQALAGMENCHIYPDASQTEARQLLARYTGADPECIVAGCGSDQLIDLLIRLFAAPGQAIINLVPTFGMYRFYADLHRARVTDVPRDEYFNIDVDAIGRAITPDTRLIFLANPNNPSGTLTPRDKIIRILETGLPVAVDEAYYEFTGETVIDLMAAYPNLMVLRTFSKWAGLAGLRIGYGIFPEVVAQYLNAIRDPYNVNAAALTAIRESFKDIERLQENVGKIIKERERLFRALQEFEWIKPYPSSANFILCRISGYDARKIQQELERQGILVRYFSGGSLNDCLRFSIGKPAEDDILLSALKAYKEK